MKSGPTCVRVFGVLLLLVAWFASPGLGEPDSERIVAIGDVHGDYAVLVGMLQEARVLDSRLEWAAPKTELVLTGDFLDRGPDIRRVLEFLMTLEREARRRGGQVHVLLGNHEVMNLVGDLRDVSPEAWREFIDSDSEKRRSKAYREYVQFSSGRGLTPLGQDEWLAAHPAGRLEYREALSTSGIYGKWLRKHPAVLQIGPVIFLHGGIHPDLAGQSPKAINERVAKELQAYASIRSYLERQRLILQFADFNEVVGAVGPALQQLKQAPEPFPPPEIALLESFAGAAGWHLFNPDGPLWFRGYAKWSDSEADLHLPGLLAPLKAGHFVVGHTPGPDIRMSYGGRVFLIDTAMSGAYQGGRASALEISNGRFTAIYTGARQPLFPASSE